jgi:signal transduction histidine kinase
VRELALHILDLVENSIRAGATVVAVGVEANPATDRLRITIEDNGSGLKVTPHEALDPFYTTKAGKRTGLGLSLFQSAAAATGGSLTIGKSVLGSVGVSITAELGLSHIDRSPLGDLAGTLASVVCTNPEIDWRFRIGWGEEPADIRTRTLARDAGIDPADGLALATCTRAALEAALHACAALT